MIYNTQSLKQLYKDYKNINQKISLEAKKGNIIRVKRGLYSDNLHLDAPIISNICYAPSYISFEYALSYYGIIPEYVSTYTAPVFNKKNNKRYLLSDVCFDYKSIPNEVFYEGVTFLQNEDNIRYKIATKEKALCDQLYSMYSVRSIKELKVLLFEDLRIDMNELLKFDFDFILEISKKYHSNTLQMFVKFIVGELLNENFD